MLDAATAAWALEQVTLYPGIRFKVLYQQARQVGRPLPSLSVLYRFLRRQGYDRRSLRSEAWLPFVGYTRGPSFKSESVTAAERVAAGLAQQIEALAAK